MPSHKGKGSRQRREPAFARRATQHHDFIGGADAERAEAEARKHERVEAKRTEDTVREMAAELEQAAGLKAGVELPLRIPRSIDEIQHLIREAPDALRVKARERLEDLPDGAKKAVRVAQDTASLLLTPLRFGINLAREVLRVPAALLNVLRHREA